MSKVSLAGNASGTGIFTIASPNSNTDRTLTLPDQTGTLLSSSAQGIPKSALPTGSVLQVVSTNSSSYTSTTSTTPIDSGISVSITPTSATSKILCFIEVNGLQRPASSNGGIKLQLVRNSTAILNFEGIASYAPSVSTTGEIDVGGSGASYLDSPATTSSTTYKLYFGSATGGNVYINNFYDGSYRSVTSITLMEIAS